MPLIELVKKCFLRCSIDSVMNTQTLNVPISSLRSLVKQDGIMLLARERYDQIVRQIVQQEEIIKRLMEEASLKTIITEGEKEFAEGRTIVARSSKEALKRYHARRDT